MYVLLYTCIVIFDLVYVNNKHITTMCKKASSPPHQALRQTDICIDLSKYISQGQAQLAQ